MLELRQICLHLGHFQLSDISFKVAKGEYFVIVGASGAGKSLILETIAGLIFPDSGDILLNERDITKEKIHKRSVGMVFQDHAVFPHMTVEQNIAYSLHSSVNKPTERDEIIADISQRLNVSHLLKRRPGTLSGGELQRVALARTLVQQPDILLLDEPLASIDVQIKNELRSLLRKINAEGQTIIHVTHDYNEAVSLASRIALLHNGTVQQIGTPREIFTKPASPFIAELSGVKNFYRARLIDQNLNSNSSDSEKIRYKILLEDKITITALNREYLFNTSENTHEGFYTIPESAVCLYPPIDNSFPENIFEGTIIDIIRSVSSTDIRVDIGIPIFVKVSESLFQSTPFKIGGKIRIAINL